jgi:hypothetical protein
MYRINDDLTTTPVSSHTGSGSVITITGSDTNFGNIYAGSINGSFDKSVEIRLTDVSRSNIGNIYSSGAVEADITGRTSSTRATSRRPPRPTPVCRSQGAS